MDEREGEGRKVPVWRGQSGVMGVGGWRGGVEWWGQWGEAKTRGTLRQRRELPPSGRAPGGLLGKGSGHSWGQKGALRGKQSRPTAGERTWVCRHPSVEFGNLAMGAGAGRGRVSL